MYVLKGTTKDSLYKYCLLRSIAYATSNAICADLNYESSWESFNYSMNDSCGSLGTITFKDNMVFGAFRNDGMEEIEDLESALEVVPVELRDIARTYALQYLLLEGDNGVVAPSVSTLLWAVEDKIFILHKQEEFYELGGGFLEYMTDGFDAYIVAIEEYFEFTESQLEFVRLIYDRKINNPNEKVFISREEIEMIENEDGYPLDEFIISFGEMNIFIEEE